MIVEYKQLTSLLSRTRDSFSEACYLIGIDPSVADPKYLGCVMCDNCGYWEEPKKVHTDLDGTNMCHACHDLETLRF